MSITYLQIKSALAANRLKYLVKSNKTQFLVF